MKTKLDNDLTDCAGAIYAEKDSKLLWLIRPGVVCDENQIAQWHDLSYRCDLCFQDAELS